jgi:hypothetical protein
VITTRHKKVIWVQQLEPKQGKDAFYRERTPIYEVAIKKLQNQ